LLELKLLLAPEPAPELRLALAPPELELRLPPPLEFREKPPPELELRDEEDE